MAGSLEEVGGVPGGDAIRRVLQVSMNDDGTMKGGGGGGTTTVGLIANRLAAAGNQGVLYFATDDTTDGTNGTMYLSTGSAWLVMPRTMRALMGVFVVEDYGAVGDGTTDDSGAFRTVAALLDVNRGGTIICRASKYYWATNVPITIDGTSIIGAAEPGVGSSLAKGSTQIIVNDGITGLTLGQSGTTNWRGMRLENLSFYEKTTGGSASTILVKMLRVNNCDLINCAFGDCTLGKGLVLDGTGDNTQYTNIVRCRFGKCAVGYQQTATNGTSFVSCYFEGADSGGTITAGSKGIYQISGDTLKVCAGTRIQGYDKLIVLTANVEHSIDDTTRYEIWTTSAVEVGSSVSRSYIGGSGDNSLKGSVGSGVVVVSGAADISVNTDIQSVSSAAARISDSGTRTRYGIRTDMLVHPQGVGTFAKAGTISDADFVSPKDGLMAIDSTDGRLYFRYGGAWHYVAQTA